MSKFLYKILLSFITKEHKLDLREKEIENKLESERLASYYEEHRNSTRRWADNDLRAVQEQVKDARFELKNIEKSSELYKAKIDSKIDQERAEKSALEKVLASKINEATRLENIIAQLTKQLNSKVEIIK